MLYNYEKENGERGNSDESTKKEHITSCIEGKNHVRNIISMDFHRTFVPINFEMNENKKFKDE